MREAGTDTTHKPRRTQGQDGGRKVEGGKNKTYDKGTPSNTSKQHQNSNEDNTGPTSARGTEARQGTPNNPKSKSPNTSNAISQMKRQTVALSVKPHVRQQIKLPSIHVKMFMFMK